MPISRSVELSFVFQADFLKGLPSYNESNFTRFHADSSCKTTVSDLLHKKIAKEFLRRSERIEGNHSRIHGSIVSCQSSRPAMSSG